MLNALKLIVSIFVCYLPGIIGGFFTTNNLYPWYDTISKPSFNPPSWVFAPVWTTLYFLMGVSLFLVLQKPNSKTKTLGLIYFAIQLILNGLWSYVFFGLHSILGVFTVIVLLLGFINLSIINFYKISKLSAYLLVPYLLWVLFVTILNLALYFLNG